MTTTNLLSSEVGDFVHPWKLTEPQLAVIVKRAGVINPTEARIQYMMLYNEQHLPTVKRELERIHAKFVAMRLKGSQI